MAEDQTFFEEKNRPNFVCLREIIEFFLFEKIGWNLKWNKILWLIEIQPIFARSSLSGQINKAIKNEDKKSEIIVYLKCSVERQLAERT